MTHPESLSRALQMERFPLTGRRLIEASAGTGKTYTIAGLYLRLLLGHGPEGCAHPQPLSVDRILVVTFTEAATAELRQRIRQRISEARLAFARGHSEDAFIRTLLAEVADHREAFRRLDRAQKQMDEAAVFTIHGFCARMLKEHAFESGSLFEAQLVQEVRPYQELAIRDFWRRHLQWLAKPVAVWVRALYPSPDALLRQIDDALSRPELKLLPEPSEPLLPLLQTLEGDIEQLRSLWQAQGEELIDLLAEAPLHRGRVKTETLAKHQRAMQAFADGGLLAADALAYINHDFLATRMKKGAEPLGHPLLEANARMAQRYQALCYGLPRVALDAVRAEVDTLKEEQAELSFDDLLIRLDRALQSAHGAEMAEAVAAQFPVAMIDEFQDTDPIQYRIFDRLYAAAQDSALLMIGDPKQAIYAFRGADIETYLRARRSTADHYNLDTNWRSATGLIEAVNHLFARQQRPFMEADIPFLPVRAAGQADKAPLRIDGAAIDPLQFWFFQDSPSASHYKQAQADACARDINRLLQLGQAGRALIGDRPLQAGDMAVLVRSGADAACVRRALVAQGVRSVYLSARDNVFMTAEARELLQLLQAALNPRDERRVRAAFATRLFDLPLSELERLNSDELALEQALESALDWQRSWRRLGVRPMLRQLLIDRGIAARLLQQPLGERRLTDLLHLAELLQEAAQQISSEHGLVRWLHEEIEQGGQAEGAQLRLESDTALVKLVTIHKSKGLEYPLVWLPFAMQARKANKALYHRDGELVLDLGGDKRLTNDKRMAEALCLLADDERMAEDLRLLYVALTRARHACFIGIYRGIEKGNGLKIRDTALGRLLQGPDEAESLDDALAACTAAAPIACLKPPSPTLPAFCETAADAPVFRARQFAGTLEHNWTLASYSRLVQGLNSGWLQPGIDLEVLREQDALSDEAQALTPYRFPRGARWGTFLHHLFEELDFGAPDQVWIAEQCRGIGLDEAWVPVVQQWVGAILATDLDARGLQLGRLPADRKWVELEFLLPLREVKADALNRLLATYRGGDWPALDFPSVQGMLTGFIDLTFCHEGRYYLLDYKSNYLGDSVDCYRGDRLQAAMAEHRYDLQALLYTLALHRLLRLRLPDYDYDTHVGGCYYLFLRALDGGDGGAGVWFDRPERVLIEQLDALLLQPMGAAC